MSFQFPANPDDGDIVVRGDLLATYTKSTNTWNVGKLNPVAGIPGPTGPQGPKGDKGDIGDSLVIDGAVPASTNLPSPSTDGTVYVTLDTGHGWVWANGQWNDMGIIMQGPQGFKGDHGDKGDKGDTGDTGPIGPQGIQGIQGEKGDLGSVTVASPTNLGGIKIGRGLSILPDGTANAGTTEVDIETAPIPSTGVRSFKPHYIQFGQNTSRTIGSGSTLEHSSFTYDWQAPAGSNGAVITFYVPTSVEPNPSNPWPVGATMAMRAYTTCVLGLTSTGGSATFGSNNSVGIPVTHNLTIIKPGTNSYDRFNAGNNTKFGLATWDPLDTNLTFTFKINIDRAGYVIFNGGIVRMTILPFVTKEGQDGLIPDTRSGKINHPLKDLISEFSADDNDITPLPPYSELEKQKDDSMFLKSVINDTVSQIDKLLVDITTGTVHDTLVGYRVELHNLRDLPGTFNAINSEVKRISDAVNAIDDYQFRFETI